ncbi:hypothetical protein PT974_04799 [Cladobotryum mycophilum]|uniref:Uncharacterized protein n=1 Tax=Cladobotryum mycophilum TaxID=491253 RepID=A0ABR0SRH9_9HYPO
MGVGRKEQSCDARDRIDHIPIPLNDWPTGVIVTSANSWDSDSRITGIRFLFAKQRSVQIGSAVGFHRLLHVSDGHLIVGLQTLFVLDWLVAEITLGFYNVGAMGYLWNQELLPPDLHVSKAISGSEKFGPRADISPLDILLFRASEEELADVVAFSADVLLSGFEVDFGTRPI